MSVGGQARPWVVRIEGQRLQTYLFTVPRLRAMLGANALLGHTLRYELPNLALAAGSLGLPYTAAGSGATGRGLDDPLDAALRQWGTSPGGAPLSDADDPATQYGAGVLSRDGGHVHVAFKDDVAAGAFAATARTYLAERLPGLRFNVRVYDGLGKEVLSEGGATAAVQLADLPVFQVCTASGIGPAAYSERDRFLSSAVADREDAGQSFQAGTGAFRDLVSLLRPELPGYADPARAPQDLEELAGGGGYLALIHVDGNRVGQRVSELKDSARRVDWLAREAAVEAFFHRMRVAVRAALVGALQKVFPDSDLARGEKLRYQLLMLGGDDLLLLCQPVYALRFVVEYARRLATQPLPGPEGEAARPLSVGVGVVIAPHSLPFHRLHQLAEGLTASAKRAYLQTRDNDEKRPPERSVVDWAVLTTSWGLEPDVQRRAYERVDYPTGDGRRECLALTGRPYFVLEDPGTPGRSLARLLEEAQLVSAAYAAREARAARSQLKQLARDVAGGRLWADLRYREVCRRLPEAIRGVFLGRPGPDPQRPCAQGSVWLEADADRYVTHVRDLVEIVELGYLGRGKHGQRGGAGTASPQKAVALNDEPTGGGA